jgi:membrane protease YdiL (CAAX protease family)
MPGSTSATNRSLLVPFLIPYAIYTGIASLPESWLSPEQSYLARLLGAGIAVAWAWRRYPRLAGPRSPAASVGVGALVGVVGTVAWVMLVRPFASAELSPPSAQTCVLRLLAATLLVPLFEEVLMRGYVLRIGVQWDRARLEGARDPFGVAFDERSIHDVEPGAWTLAAVAGSTLLFTLGHSVAEWPAAVVYGLGMAALWIWRRDLLSCIVAHAVTNFTLGLYVITTGSWEVW